MILPLVVIVLAILSAGVVAYGSDSVWGGYRHGIDFILLSRRLQWPLAIVAILLCITLIAVVVTGRWRLWFLVGLAPVLALFAHRFMAHRAGPEVTDAPQFMAASEAAVGDDDYVVGLIFGDHAYAFPYDVLFNSPVVLQSDHQKRMILLWSAYANRAVAVEISHDLKARDLEIVGSPANALIVYDARVGQFINGVTGKTAAGGTPTGFAARIAAWKMPWKVWRETYPETEVMRASVRVAAWPTRPILPAYAVPASQIVPAAEKRVALVEAAEPVAIDPLSVGDRPFNFDAGDCPVFVFRPSPRKPIVGFDRRLPNDLRPRFDTVRDPKRPAAAFLDRDTGSRWSASGTWLDGAKELKGKKLARVPIDDDLDWNVIKFWYPRLALLKAPASGD